MVIYWSWFGEKWYSISEDGPQSEWDRMAEKMILEFGESGHPVFRATSPLSRGQLKSKGGGKLSIHYCADLETIETIFRTITSVNQLGLYGAIAEMCEENETYHDRTGATRCRGQSSSSFVPSVIKTKHNEEECLANARLVSLHATRFGGGQWSFIGPGSEKKWISNKEDNPQGIWDKIAEKLLLEFR